MVKCLFIFMFNIGSNGCFVTGAPGLDRGHGYGRISSMGQPRSDLVGLLMMDSSVPIRGTDIVLKVPRDSANPA
jgi:hypothetical protein